jgi:SAM-dependent methyltransferase
VERHNHSAALPQQYQARDPFAAGQFPVCAATHDLGVRWLFDLSTLIIMLECRPGDRVLDLGAGSGFSSEMLARFGYDVVAIDPDYDALTNNRRRPTFDSNRIDGRVQVVQAIAERLPFADSVFDGALGMNVLHHVQQLPAALAELARVLKPSAHATFCEPGLDHLQSNETQRAIHEHGENDRPFDVLALLQDARRTGFSDAMLTATLQPPLRMVPIEEVDLYLSGNHPRPPLTPRGVIDELHRRHAYAVLVREGARPRTSRHPGLLRCELNVTGIPETLSPGQTVKVNVTARNTGDTLWLSKPSRLGGFVTCGCKLLRDDGRLLSDTLGRTPLRNDVGPGEQASIEMRLVLPPSVSPGVYTLRFDLVDELVCWFSDLHSDSGLIRTIAVH